MALFPVIKLPSEVTSKQDMLLFFFSNFIDMKFTCYRFYPFKVSVSLVFNIHRVVQPSPRIPEQRNPVSISSYSSCLLVVSSRKPLMSFLSSVCFPILDILYEWSPPVCRVMTGTFHSAIMFSGFYLVSRYQSFILFSWLSNRRLYEYNTLWALRLMGLWVVAALWLL